MGEPVEVLMFGSHNVEAAHEHAIDVTEAALKAAIDLKSDDLPVYYAVIGLLRAAVRLGVIGLGPMVDGMEPMLRMMIQQEIKNVSENSVTVQ